MKYTSMKKRFPKSVTLLTFFILSFMTGIGMNNYKNFNLSNSLPLSNSLSHKHVTTGFGFSSNPESTIEDTIINTKKEVVAQTVKKGNSPPIATCNNLIIQLDAQGRYTLTSIDILEIGKGSYDPDGGSVTMTVNINSFDCTKVGSIPVTLTVTDTDGMKASCSATVTVTDGTPPQGVLCRPYTAILGNDGTVTVYPSDINTSTPTDNCGIASYLISKNVGGPYSPSLTYNCSDIRTNGVPIYISVTDLHGNGSYCSTLIQIRDNNPPTITCPPNKVVSCQDIITPFVLGTATATDNCGILPSSAITFSDEKINGSCSSSYTIKRTWKATDNSNNSSYCIQTITVQDISKPVLTGQGSSITINCPELPVFTAPRATDMCDPSPVVTYTDQTVTGTCAGSYSITRTWIATDACGNASLPVSQTITVQDITKPVLNGQGANETLNCPATPTFKAPVATDACDSNPVITYIDVTTPGACAGAYTMTRTWIATDACKNVSLPVSQSITIQDITKPVLSGQGASSTISCPATPVFIEPKATDACDASPKITFTDVTLPGTILGTFTTTRTWIATDACNNVSLPVSQSITVLDKTVPYITVQASNKTVVCDGLGNTKDLNDWLLLNGNAIAKDTCGDLKWTNDFKGLSNLCGATGSASVIFTASDASMNAISTKATFTIIDTTAPVITCLPDISVNSDSLKCGATIKIPQPAFIEKCSSVTIVNSFNQTADASGFYPVGTTLVKWTLTDECGNSSTCAMKVIVTDKRGPVITTPPDIIICSNEKIELGTATAVDDCGLLNITNDAPSSFNPGSTIVTWTATDIHGNKTTKTQKVIVKPLALVNAGTDAATCSGFPFTVKTASAQNAATLNWTHNGLGTLTNSTTLTPTYTPAIGETGLVTLTVTATSESPCKPESKDNMVLTIYPKLQANANVDQTIVKGAITTLIGSASGGSGGYLWNWEPSQQLVNNKLPNPKTLPLHSQTPFILTVQDNAAACSARDTMVVLILPNQPPVALDDYTTTAINTAVTINLASNDMDPDNDKLNVTFCSSPQHGNVKILADNTITYTPNADFTGSDSFFYQICDNGSPLMCDTARVIISIFPIRDFIQIFNLVTPNGDGKNDTWIIRGINELPDNDIVILNRWGDEIRTFKSYNNFTNRWDGTNKQNEQVPDGVYYYIIKIKEVNTYAGWVYVNRKGKN